MGSKLDAEALKANQNMAARNYWRKRMDGFSLKKYFTDRKNSVAEYSRPSALYTTDCREVLRTRLNALAASPKARHIVLLSVLGVLAHKYAGSPDICLFTPVYGPVPEGAATDPVPVFMKGFETNNFREILQTAGRQLQEDFSYADYPLEKILLTDYQGLGGFSPVGIMLETLQQDCFGPSAPGMVFRFEDTDRLQLTITYRPEQFSETFVNVLAATYFRLLEQLLEDTARTVADIPLLGPQETADVLNGLDNAPVTNDGNVPASYHQERLWFIDQFETGYLYPGKPVYHNIPLHITFDGNVDIALLQQCFSAVVNRHVILHTAVVNREEALCQVVRDHNGCQLAVHHVQDKAAMSSLLDAAADKSFEEDELYVRGTLIVHAGSPVVLSLVMRHIIADRYTVTAVAGAIMAAYNAGGILPAADHTISYAAFARWQKTTLQQLKPGLLAYWRRQLGPSVQALELPTDRPRAAIHIYRQASAQVSFSAALNEKITTFSRQHHMPVNIILMAAFKVLLYRYARQEEIVIGTSVDYRHMGRLSGILGPLSNLIVLKSNITAAGSFMTCLQALATTVNKGLEHGMMPFDLLVEELAPEKDMSRTALFDVLFRYEETPPPVWSLPGGNAAGNDLNAGYGKYDLNLFLQQCPDGLQGCMTYNADYYDAATITAMLRHYCNITDSLLSSPEMPVSAATLLDENEKTALLQQLNNIPVAYPEDQHVVSLFEEQAVLFPERTALRYGTTSITYASLHERSTCVAAGLRKQGVGPGTIAGIYMDRSIDLIIGIMAILKAGGAYLPIDPDYPEDRVRFLLGDSRAVCVLGNKKSAINGSSTVTCVLEELEAACTATSFEAPVLRPDDLCYIIYTSGTTGRPKGVMVTHRNVVRLFRNDGFQFAFGPEDVWTLFHSHCFDFSVWEIFGALLFGGKLIIVPKMVARDTRLFRQLVRSEGVTVLNQTPTAFYNFIYEELSDPETRLGLRYIIFGGEKLNPAKLKEWHARYPQVKLINMYGITETTVHVTYKELQGGDLDSTVSNIGRPIPTLGLYVLDNNRQVLPAGVPGELYVGGAGVTAGYLYNEQLTADRFIPDPVTGGGRLYRTGDLARLLPDGELEYLGRIDHQIQLRGFRVELGEIEARLEEYPAISKAVVMAAGKEDDTVLIAYYVAAAALRDAEIKSYLSGKLPDYMVPNQYVFLETLPLTSNGKLDKKALPAPTVSHQRDFQAPEGETAIKLAGIWSEVLNIPAAQISINADFFELGGHSLRAMTMVNRILLEFNVVVPLKEVFERKNIAGIAELIEGAATQTAVSLVKATEAPFYPLSPAQKAIYFFQEFDRSTLGYNMPRVLQLRGQLDKSRVEKAFRELLQRHESFRTSFETAGDDPVQRIHETVPFRITLLRAAEHEIRSVIQEQIFRFELSRPPLLRVALVEVHPLEHYLVVDSHHIVMDGTSWGLLTREFRDGYCEAPLPPVKWQYRDFVAWQETPARQQVLLQQRRFWEDLFAADTVPLDLRTDFPRPEVKNNQAGDFTFQLSLEEVTALKELTARENITPFIALLSVFKLLLHKLTGKNDIVVGTPVAGREHSDLHAVMGMFVNVLPVRSGIAVESTYRDWLRELRSLTLSCFEHQAFEYAWLAGAGHLQRQANRSALFDVMFIYQNFEESVLEIPGLSVQPFTASEQVAEFDLSLTVYEGDEAIQLSFGYQTALFKEETIQRYAHYFRRILATVTRDAAVTIADIGLATPEELHRSLAAFNDTQAPWPHTDNLPHLFETTAAGCPDIPCLVFSDRTWTYAATNNMANRLCRYLQQSAGIKPGDIVGVLSAHNDLAILSILAILKAGAVFLPLDPGAPEARLAAILADAGVNVLLTTSENNVLHGVRHIRVDAVTEEMLPHDHSNPTNTGSAADTAFVIYTSGSTGKPKGVLQTHQTIMNLVTWQARQEGAYHPPKRTSQFAAYAFDVSVQEIFYALLNGHTLFIVPEDVRYVPADMAAFVARHALQTVFLPTAYLDHFAAAALSLDAGSFRQLERIIVAGEALKITQPVRQFFRQQQAVLENQYGPAEAHVVTACTLSGNPDEWPLLPDIGKPVANTAIYILDAHDRPLPAGITGELCIAGVGVSPGYLGLPALTKEKFLPHPFGEGYLYKTGDLACWRPDGSLSFSGRKDDQVKIRGFRIEPVEIEQVIAQYPGVEQVAVMVRDHHGQQKLAAYFRATVDIAPADMRTFIAALLPAYMLPEFYVQLPELPLTRNGKLDRAALPEPATQPGETMVPCEGAIETALADIWAAVLGMETAHISATTSFFETGGHSLNAITLINKVQHQFNVRISLKELFAKPDIRRLATLIDLHDWMGTEPAAGKNDRHEMLI